MIEIVKVLAVVLGVILKKLGILEQFNSSFYEFVKKSQSANTIVITDQDEGEVDSKLDLI